MYARGRARAEAESHAYRVYVTDALYYLGRNSTPAKRWVEIIHPAPDYDAEQVVEDLTRRIGLEVS